MGICRVPKIEDATKRYDLSQSEVDGLMSYYLLGLSQEQCFAYMKPEFRIHNMLYDLTRQGKMACKEFFAYAKVAQFLSDYDYLYKHQDSDANVSARTENAVKKLTSRVIDKMSSVEELDDMETVFKLAKNCGILQDNEDTRAPERYLPERCDECRYKRCIEELYNNKQIVIDEEV